MYNSTMQGETLSDMTKINPEVRINNIHIGGDGHPDKWYLIVWGKPSTRESMEELKQQILSNDIIVERLKAIIEETNVECSCEYGGCRHSFANELQSILEGNK